MPFLVLFLRHLITELTAALPKPCPNSLPFSVRQSLRLEVGEFFCMCQSLHSPHPVCYTVPSFYCRKNPLSLFLDGFLLSFLISPLLPIYSAHCVAKVVFLKCTLKVVIPLLNSLPLVAFCYPSHSEGGWRHSPPSQPHCLSVP